MTNGFIVAYEYPLFENVIKCYLLACLCETPNRRYIYESCGKTLVFNCANDQPYGAWSVLHRYLSISYYEDVIFNFSYFITVPIGKTCSISLLTLSKFSQCFKAFMFPIETFF